jgi:hypothetical protein
LALVFFLATLVLPCILRRREKKKRPAVTVPIQNPALEQQADASRKEQVPEAPESEFQAPERASRALGTESQAPPESEFQAPERASRALKTAEENLPEPYEVCSVYQPLRRSCSVRYGADNDSYVKSLQRELKELHALTAINRQMVIDRVTSSGASRYENVPAVRFHARSNSWMFHRPAPPPPPGPPLLSRTTDFSKRALPPTPAPRRLLGQEASFQTQTFAFGQAEKETQV